MIQKLYKLSSEKENMNSSSSETFNDNSHSKLKKREIKQKCLEEEKDLEFENHHSQQENSSPIEYNCEESGVNTSPRNLRLE
jgi:hypothetical protein